MRQGMVKHDLDVHWELPQMKQKMVENGGEEITYCIYLKAEMMEIKMMETVEVQFEVLSLIMFAQEELIQQETLENYV